MSRPYCLAEVEVSRAGALQLEEVVESGQLSGGVKDLSGLLTTRYPGDDRAEERRATDRDDRRADLFADAFDAVLVRGTHRVVQRCVVSRGGELEGQPGRSERLFIHRLVEFALIVVTRGAKCGVERPQCVGAVGLLDG